MMFIYISQQVYTSVKLGKSAGGKVMGKRGLLVLTPVNNKNSPFGRLLLQSGKGLYTGHR